MTVEQPNHSKPAIQSKGMIMNIARKWGVGVCLMLWCMLGAAAIAAPALLIYGALVLFDAPDSVMRYGRWLGSASWILLGPIIAYYFGKAFGLRYDKIPTEGSR